MKAAKTESFWRAIGGRKQANGYLYAVLITVMVFRLNGEFDAYALWLAAALLGTSAIVAMEDRKAGGRAFPRRRASDTVSTDTPEAS